MTEKSRKSGKPKKERTRKQKIISHVTTALLVAVLLVGVGVMAYPTFSDWWNNLHQSKAIATYEEVVADTSQEELDEMWAAAEAFNEKVAAAGFSLQYSDEMEKEYESLLDVSGTGIMGYVEIDSVGIKLPIYHGTSEGVLQIAVSRDVGGRSADRGRAPRGNLAAGRRCKYALRAVRSHGPSVRKALYRYRQAEGGRHIQADCA